MDSVDMGASISCAGICLTVVDKGADWFAVDVSAETLSCTAQGQFVQRIAKLTLERALKVGDELGGHIVHRSYRWRWRSNIHVEETGDSQTVHIKVPTELAPLCCCQRIYHCGWRIAYRE